MTPVSVKLVPPIHTEHMESRAVMPRKPNVTTVEKNPGSRLGYICGHQAGDIMQRATAHALTGGPDIQVASHYNLRRQRPVITGSLYPRNRLAAIIARSWFLFSAIWTCIVVSGVCSWPVRLLLNWLRRWSNIISIEFLQLSSLYLMSLF